MEEKITKVSKCCGAELDVKELVPEYRKKFMFGEKHIFICCKCERVCEVVDKQ